MMLEVVGFRIWSAGLKVKARAEGLVRNTSGLRVQGSRVEV